MRFGLERMRRLMTALDSPQERFRSDPRARLERQVVDGAHDRGAAASAHGLRTGAYLSPHLASWAERVEVGGRAGHATSASRRRSRAPPRRRRWSIARSSPGDRVTQFEALTAAAYWELARAGVEVAVVEAGLGGRYDATSVIRSARAGADQREPRAHALARPDRAPHRRGEAGGRAARAARSSRAGSGPRRSRSRSAWPPSGARRSAGADCAWGGATSTTRGAVPASGSRRGRVPARELRGRGGGGRGASMGGPLDPARVRAPRPAAARCRAASRWSATRPAHDPRRRAQPGGARALAASLLDAIVGGRAAGGRDVGPRRQGRGRHARGAAAASRRASSSRARRTAARCRRRRSRASGASSAAARREIVPDPVAALAARARAGRARTAPCSSPAPSTCCRTWRARVAERRTDAADDPARCACWASSRSWSRS